ncbi:MAG TPA: DNA-formamidopyrimidine glycosylase family protein [Capsulimonadaceae bacterium]|nr:DNA-formamidopyrimidine glycosylase family protein [Capsulimonadaceae bacterium]
MPELPDIVVYIEALEKRIVGHTLTQVRLNTPFLLRTADPPIKEAEGKKVRELRRIGKRIAIGLEGDLWLVLHLMIAGRLHWKEAGTKIAGKAALAAFDFDNGILTLTEAGTKRRASLHFVEGQAALEGMDPGGLEVLDADLEEFAKVLTSRNHTLKRALTDPHLFSGIGNSYSDEILFQARMSPVTLTQRLSQEDIRRLYWAIRGTLSLWTERLREDAGEGFPEKVTAFRKDMAVHGRYGQPCIECASPIQRIRYADNETNYCVHCQTGGKLLADRAMSRLLHQDWPKTLEELEQRTGKR